MTLGLDLRGGFHIVLEVDASGLIKEHLQHLMGDARSQIQKNGIAGSYQRDAGAVIVTLRDASQVSSALALLKSQVGQSDKIDNPEFKITTPAPSQIVLTLNREGIRDRVWVNPIFFTGGVVISNVRKPWPKLLNLS